MYDDQYIFGGSLLDSGKSQKRVIDLLRSLYANPAVKKWVINYSPDNNRFFFNLKDNPNERTVHIYIGHGSEPRANQLKVLAPVFKKFPGPVKDGLPTGPLVIHDACFCRDWFDVLPPNMRVSDKCPIEKKGVITFGEQMKILPVSLVQTIDIVNQWRKQDPNASVTVYVTIGYADDAQGRRKMTPEEKKEYANAYMSNWIVK